MTVGFQIVRRYLLEKALSNRHFVTVQDFKKVFTAKALGLVTRFTKRFELSPYIQKQEK